MEKKIKVGIVTCFNATQDLNCCSVSCLRDFNKRSGEFKKYPESSNVILAGIVSCANCPTSAYPEKILRKINSLVTFGVKHIHLSYCMLALCPFLNKYINVIKEKFPEVEVIKGTHEAHITFEEYRDDVKKAFEENKDMNDIILRRL